MGSPMLMFVALLALAVLSAVQAAPQDKGCAVLDKPCSDSKECCGGCCRGNTCAAGDACMTAVSPCSLHDCPPNKVCYLLQVECLQSPCKSIPACKADDSDYD